MSAEDFVTLLEQRDLLPPEMLVRLRRQIAQAGKSIPAAKLARLLIDKGYLTPKLVKRLLGSDAESVPEQPAVPGPVMAAPPAPKPLGEEKLGLVPLAEETSWDPRLRRRTPPATMPSDAASKLIESPAPPPPSAQAAFIAPPPVVKPPPPPPRQPESLLEMELAAEEETPPGGVLLPEDALLTRSADAPLPGNLLAVAPEQEGLRGFFRRRGKPGKKEDWGSPLMLVGGGVLLVLIFLLVLLTWRIFREGGDELLEKAADDYRAGSYAQAIHDYEVFLEKYPHHPNVSLARVKRGLAQLRQVTQPGSDWSAALKTATEVLPQIRQEDEFKEAHEDLSGILSAIAEGLAAKARETADPVLVRQTRQALDYLSNANYVPKPPAGKIEDLKASLALTERQIQKNEDRKTTLAAIRKAVAAKQPAEAYALQKKLLKRYPDLLDDPQLTEAEGLITEAQKAEVRFVEQSHPAVREAPATSTYATLALLQRQLTSPVPALEDVIRVVAAEGTVYGLEAATGKVRWRLSLGGNPQAQSAPPVTLDPAKDVVLVDPGTQSLLRIASGTGEVQWRFAVGEAFEAAPVFAAGQILLATPSGKLYVIDAATGDSPGFFQLPQALRVAPAVDSVRGLIYQPADHANLYVLQLDDRSCRAVYLLGHEESSLRIPPVIIGGLVVVGINEGARESSLRLLSVSVGDSGKSAVKTLQQIHLQGRLDTPPAVDETRLLSVTDLGLVSFFELTETAKAAELRPVAETPLPDGGKFIRFPLLKNGQFWIADQQLARYDILGVKGQLVPKWITESQSAFLQPPELVGSALMYVRRSKNFSSVFAAAVGKEEPNPFWQSQLSAPLVALISEESGKKNLLAVTATGGLYRFDPESLRGEILRDDPLAQVALAQLPGPVTGVIPLDNGRLALSFGPGKKQLVVLDPRETPARIYLPPLPADPGGEPLAFFGGILVPLVSGQVVLLDPLSGEPKLEPFQPKLPGSGSLTWQRPALCGPQEFVIADNQRRLYYVGVKDKPVPHLALLQQAALPGQAATPVAVVGQTVFLACANQTLGAFTLPKLARAGKDKEERRLSAPCVWGPQGLGERVLLATQDGRLSCWDASANVLWQVNFKHGPPVGRPLADGGRIILATQNGVLAVLDGESGKETSAVDLGHPLTAGPVATGDRWLVGGSDGCVYAVEKK